jgi:hypothetical protein
MTTNDSRSFPLPVNHTEGDTSVSQTTEEGTPLFYGEGSEAEAERLQLMAQQADRASLYMIASHLAVETASGKTVVDVGAGDSISLGKTLQSLGIVYRPVDMRQDAVDKHHAAGFEATRSVAGSLDIAGDTADVVHSRFTLAWLSPAERTQALSEMIRTAKQDAALALIDYDWSTIEGPDIFIEMTKNLQHIMREAGFDPYYGAEIEKDVTTRLTDLVGSDNVSNSDETAITINTTHRFPTYEGPLRGAIGTLEQTAYAVIEQLKNIGAADEAASVKSDIESLRRYSKTYGDEDVKLPDIVALGVSLKDKSSLPSLSEKHILNVEYSRVVDYDIPFSEMPHTVLVTSEAMITEARRVQAAAYEKDRMVSPDAIDPLTGMLTTNTDPLELVRRSRYYATMKDGRIAGGVRRIDMDDTGITSLPTIGRLFRHGGDTTRDWLHGHDIARKYLKCQR